MLFLFTMLIAPAGPAQAKYAAIVVDAETGRVLFERNADTRNYPASLTKMMTLYMVFDAVERGRLSMNQRLKVSRRAAGQAPSRLGLKAGSTITVREAVLALVTKSANDVATVVAEALGDGKESTFARRMTDKAKTLGMSRTQFRNASGLPNRRQKSTARDMARLAVALQRDFPQYYKFFSAQKFSWKKRTYVNHNRLLADYTGTDGIKTGYTRASGFNLVASTKRNGTRLIGVVFGGKTSKTRNKHMVHIMNLGFKRANDPARLASAKVMSLPNGTYALSKRFRQVPLPAMRPASATTVAVITPKTRPAAVKPVAAAAAALKRTGDATVTTASGKVPVQRLTTGGGWGVQVGAFSARPAAEERLTKLSIRFPRLFRGDDAMVDKVERHGGVFYRAQFRGLNERGARDACRVLADSRMACVAVPPTEAALHSQAHNG